MKIKEMTTKEWWYEDGWIIRVKIYTCFFRPPIGVLKIFIEFLELIITCYDKIVIWFLWKWKPAERFFRYRKNDE